MTALLVDYGQREFRLNLLHHARIAASSFSPQQVTNLVNSSKGDRKNVCEPVWERLHKIQQAIPTLDYIYLMQQVDGQVHFFADTGNPPCYDYSGADSIYTEASPELQNIFATGQSFVEGPLADQWGNWVSGVAPIIDPQTGDVIAVLGVDIDAAVYRQKIAIFRVFGLSITLLTWLLVLKFHFIYRRVRISRDHHADLNHSLTLEISKRQQVEKALSESENLFRSIFANTAAGVVTVTVAGEFLKANPAFCQMLGYSEAELAKMNQRDITHPDDLESSEKIYCDVTRHKPERFENEKRYVRKDGTTVWGQITGSWVYDDENLIHAVLLVLDITERKRVEDELRVQEELLDNIIDHVPASIFWKDRQLVYLGCNQMLAKQAGFDRSTQVIGKSDYDLPWKKEEADFFRACDRQVMETAQPMLDIEESQQQADGRWPPGDRVDQ